MSPDPAAPDPRPAPAPGSIPAPDPASRIENAGLDVIAESERKGRPRDLFMPWFAANISVLGLSWGAWVLGFGLSFVQAAIAGTIGVVVSFLACGVVAVLGKRGSAPTLALSRAAFGYNGNRLSAAISWMLTVGWETVLCVTATLASATVLQTLGWHNRAGAQIVGFLLTVGLAAFAGILGFDTIMRVQTWITLATGVLTVVYLLLVAPRIDLRALAALPAGGAAAFIGALVMVATGFGLGWVNAAADYSRYLPRTASTPGVIGWTAFGSSLPCVVLVIAGTMLVGSDAALGTAIDSDPIGALATILPTWFLIPFALVAILGLAGGIILDLYSSGLSLLATGLPVRRYVATAVDATIMTVGTIAVVLGLPRPLPGVPDPPRRGHRRLGRRHDRRGPPAPPRLRRGRPVHPRRRLRLGQLGGDRPRGGRHGGRLGARGQYRRLLAGLAGLPARPPGRARRRLGGREPGRSRRSAHRPGRTPDARARPRAGPGGRRRCGRR